MQKNSGFILLDLVLIVSLSLEYTNDILGLINMIEKTYPHVDTSLKKTFTCIKKKLGKQRATNSESDNETEEIPQKQAPPEDSP